MPNLKLWSLISLILIHPLNDNEVVNAKESAILLENTLFGGFVGCFWQDVCVENEVCVDDSLFGKCETVDETQLIQPKYLTHSKIEQLEDVINHFTPTRIDWNDIRLQCIVRSIIRSSDALSARNAARSCGVPLNEEEDYFKLAFLREPFASFDKPATNHFLGSTQTITRKLKRRFHKDEGQRAFLADAYPLWQTMWNDREDWQPAADLKPKAQVGNKQRWREDFDKELKRMILLLQDKDYPEHENLLHTEENESDQNPKEVAVNLSGDRASRGWMSSRDAYTEEPLKRRYQLRLPDDLQPLPQRTRSWVWTKFYRRSLNTYEAEQFLKELFYRLNLASPIPTFHLDKTGHVLYFQVPANTGTTAEAVAQALREGKGDFEGFHAEQVGFGRGTPLYPSVETAVSPKKYTVTLVVCLSIVSFVAVLFLAYCIQICRRKIQDRRKVQMAQKFSLLEAKKQPDYRTETPTMVQRMHQLFEQHLQPAKMKAQQAPSHVITEHIQPSTEAAMGQPLHNPSEYRHSKETILTEVSNFPDQNRKSTIEHKDSLTSQASSTYSWSSEPVACGIDVTTGHLILSYMETYLRDESHLSADWEAVSTYEAEEATPCVDAQKPENLMKNRLIAPLPYEQSRVRLRFSANDYINASLIYDHTPRNPVYIATPTPLIDTLADFWQMVWEQSSVVIVCLERPAELRQPHEQQLPDSDLTDASIQYWPNEGTCVYGNFEVHLVSEHSSCEKYIVRSLYLKNLQSAETRTVTQFHYLNWNNEKLKSETKSLLEFRRKVNRSFRGMMSPIVVHCPDGSGRSGTYMLLDLVLNRIAKGIKEINIAATLEHLRDQRQSMVQCKEQYEFVFTAVAHEVDMMLKMNSQNG